MKRHAKGYVAEILTGRASVLELIVVAIVLAIAIEFAAAGMIAVLNLQPKWNVVTGIILAAVSLLVFRLAACRFEPRSCCGYRWLSCLHG